MWIWSSDCVHKMLKEKGKGSEGEILKEKRKIQRKKEEK